MVAGYNQFELLYEYTEKGCLLSGYVVYLQQLFAYKRTF